MCVFVCVEEMWSCDILVLLSLCVWTCGCVLSQVMLYSYLWTYQDTYYISYDVTCIGILYTYRSTCSCACDKCLPSFFMFCGSLVPHFLGVFARTVLCGTHTHRERDTAMLLRGFKWKEWKEDHLLPSPILLL